MTLISTSLNRINFGCCSYIICITGRKCNIVAICCYFYSIHSIIVVCSNSVGCCGFKTCIVVCNNIGSIIVIIICCICVIFIIIVINICCICVIFIIIVISICCICVIFISIVISICFICVIFIIICSICVIFIITCIIINIGSVCFYIGL